MSAPKKAYYTPTELAERWDVSTMTVHRMIDRGDLPALRLDARIKRVPAEALAEYEAARTAVAS